MVYEVERCLSEFVWKTHNKHKIVNKSFHEMNNDHICNINIEASQISSEYLVHIGFKNQFWRGKLCNKYKKDFFKKSENIPKFKFYLKTLKKPI